MRSIVITGLLTFALFALGRTDGQAMESISMNQLLAATGGTAIDFESDAADFTRIEIDSRKISHGDLFWALEGDRHDGHAFVAEAMQRGAAACVVQQDKQVDEAEHCVVVPNTLNALQKLAGWYRDSLITKVVGVTGSVGKTTTREMIHAAVGGNRSSVRSPRNYNNHIGVPLSIFEIESHHEIAVLELGASRVGEIRELSRIAAPDIGVVTAIAPAHLSQFGSEAEIVAAKAELVESLPPSGVAVLAGDDPRVDGLAGRADCWVVRVGEKHHNDLRAMDVIAERNNIQFRVDQERYEISATGRHHLTAALCAIAVARELGLKYEEIAAGLRKFVPMPGRCRGEQIGPWFVIDDSYNASPRSMQAACEVLRDWSGNGKKHLVVGDMLELGDRTIEFHRQLGRTAAESGIDHLLAFGQQSEHILHGAYEAGLNRGHAKSCVELDTLLGALADRLEPGDVVLVKGSRAMRMERVVDWLRDRADKTIEQSHPVATHGSASICGGSATRV